MNRTRRSVRALLSLCLCAVLLTGGVPSAAAAERVLLPEQARSLAIGSSREITKKHNEIILKKMKYVEAVDVAKAKVKNKKTFRWSPLLSFQFPQPLNMMDEYDLNIKPLNLQSEIVTLQHACDDLRHTVTGRVNKLYAKVYIAQEKIDFTQALLDAARDELTRNRARVVAGGATQTDVDTMTRRVENLTTELSNLKRDFEIGKGELTNLIKLDVTSGYRFRNPIQELALPRSALESVITHTLENDQPYHEAKAAASVALVSLNAYESLMRRQYGGKMDIIQGFINMAKQGQDVDYAAFQIKYREFITAIDKYWTDIIRILFFRFTREWRKGEIDGSRYIEDEMYAVYTACMEYANAKNERDGVEKDLRRQVASSYESLMDAWRSYQSMAAAVESLRVALEKASILNKLGRVEYGEVKDARESYQSAQIDVIDALALYYNLLCDLDRLTCGAVTKYLKGVPLDTGAGSGGDSFSGVDVIEDPYYYIYTSVADLTFHIGVSIPERFQPAVTDFEVWNEGIQIGTRTPVGREVRHLAIDYGGTSHLLLRLYDGDKFVVECEVDATIPRDVLDLGGGAEQTESARVLGSYKVTAVTRGSVNTSELTLILDASVGAGRYSIRYGDQGIYTSETMELTQPFRYLSLLITSLDQVELQLYDRGGAPIATARFDTASGTVLEMK